MHEILPPVLQENTETKEQNTHETLEHINYKEKGHGSGRQKSDRHSSGKALAYTLAVNSGYKD